YLRHFSAAGFDCYAISRRGRAGRPGTELENIRISDYCEDAEAVLAEIGGEPIVLGHSLGGVVAMKLAEEGRIRALVLVAAAAPWALPPGLHSTIALGPNMPAIMLGRPFMVSEAGAARLLLNGLPEPMRNEAYSRFPRESGAVFRQLLTGTAPVDDSKVRCPVLYVRGSDDRVVSGRVGRKVAQTFHGEFKEYQGFGHWFVEEPGWERPADDIVGWIDAKL
ncbi:MAG: alpha/beta fold hydrolase, partial [Solirubrobacterales bacterium]|nr:alpha/beta fold hydrolase [Solirubrobacterales bacterium]